MSGSVLSVKKSIFGVFAALALTTIVLVNIYDFPVFEFIRFTEKATLQSLSFQCSNAEPREKEIAEPFSALVVQTCGNIIDRVRQFNVAFSSIRIQKWKQHVKTTDWNISSSKNLTLLAEWKDDYFQSLSNFSQVTLVILPWLRKFNESANDWSSLRDASNLPIHEYYESTASDPLCKWIETPGMVEFSFDVINNWTCNRNTTRAALPQSISLLALNAKALFKNYYYPSMFPKNFFTEYPSVLYSLYIVESGLIAGDGNVYIKNAKIVPYACFPDAKLNPPKDVHKFPIYEEVFVMTQSYAQLNYHRLAENIPRLAVLVDFLVRNPNIKIHAYETHPRTAQYLTMLGINVSRIVTGYCRAEVVYLPRAIMCCFQNLLETQLLSRSLRRYAKKNLAPIVRNKIIVIRRSNHRYFAKQTVIENVVRDAAMDYNLTYETFTDKPLPSISHTMRLFNSAVMVVAPHGAGLANLVFSDPGTFVIEGVCNRQNTNLFFQRTALVLGHRYHGIPSTNESKRIINKDCIHGVVTIKPSVIDETVRTYLNFLASRHFAYDSSSELNL